MTTTTSTQRHADHGDVRRALRLLLHPMLHLVLVLGAGLGLAGMDTHGAVAAHSAPPAAAPAPMGDGYADHGLFHQDATLDTGNIDDLRTDPEGQCLATDGVMTPAGDCVDAAILWADEVDAGTWNALLAVGYTWDLIESEPGSSALLIPAEMVVLGGEGGEHVLAVDLDRPLTARS